MDQSEIEIAIDELEQRVERLRSLFEQYFLGIEKIEPAVAQKDVERRIWVLRRVQVRNSLKRFRLQAIIQRYNTYQQHWVRVCRDIENGTYRRHLRRADERFTKPALTIAARRRKRVELDEGDVQEVNESSEDVSSPAVSAMEPAAAGRSGNALGANAPARPGGVSAGVKLPAIPGAAKPLPAIPGQAPGATSASEAKLPPAPSPPRGAPAALPPRPSPPRVVAKAEAGPQAAKAGSSALSEQRIKELHTELAREKQKLSDSANVSLDGLAKRLRVAEAKLQQQHRGKNVDFRVVVEGGKAVVKPVLR